MNCSTESQELRPEPKRFWRLAWIVALSSLLGACGGEQVTREGAYSQIEPKAPLPPDAKTTSSPDNLIVRIDNVADQRTSYKNYVVLYVNNREVAPPEGITNLSSTYAYSMRLQEGIYEVRAEYHAVGSWRKRVFKVVPEDVVKVLPNQRALLEVRLKKDERGGLGKTPPRFRLRYAKLPTEAAVR